MAADRPKGVSGGLGTSASGSSDNGGASHPVNEFGSSNQAGRQVLALTCADLKSENLTRMHGKWPACFRVQDDPSDLFNPVPCALL